MLCEWWPLFRQGWKYLAWGWYLLLLVTLIAWIISFLIEQSCEFVQIQTSSNNNNNTTNVTSNDEQLRSFGRGTTRGRWEPDDSCQRWSSHASRVVQSRSEAFLDPAAVAGYAGATISVALGLCVVGYLILNTCCYSSFPAAFQKWIALPACIILAGLQAMTHAMIHSNVLCKNVHIVVGVGDDTGGADGGQQSNSDPNDGDNREEVVYDTCSNDTTAYRLTYVTIGLWLTAAALFATLRLRKIQVDNEDNPTINHNNAVLPRPRHV